MFGYMRFRAARATADLISFCRQHVPGMIVSLIASALGLPYVSKLAGADVSQEVGLLIAYGLLGPIVLVALVFLGFYWLAPSRIHADQIAKMHELRNEIARLGSTDEDPRMSFQELIDFAETECGWQIRTGDTLDGLDLMDWISDAAGIGRVKLYGRYNPENFSNLRSISMVEIQVSHWIDHQLQSFEAIYDANSRPYSRKRVSREIQQVYCDVHVDRYQAKKYLKLDAVKWHGRNYRVEQERKSRHAEFEELFSSKKQQT